MGDRGDKEVSTLELGSNEARESLPIKARGRAPDFGVIVRMAAPLILSESFRRLSRITFLGILSPAYSRINCHPIRYSSTLSDGNRKHHSLAVALLAGKMAERLSLSATTVRYAIVWGLLHDIATWPLSHTGEAAFANVTDTGASKLRRMMIKGDGALHRSLRVYHSIREMRLDVDLLLGLFDKKSELDRGEMSDLHKLLHSALTPDTLEGMHRSGNVFGLSVPDPRSFIDAMERDLVSGQRLKRSHSPAAINFWRAKGRIYSEFINKEETVAFESSWSAAIRDSYLGVDLSESLYASEEDVLRNVTGKHLSSTHEVVRYKNPLTYRVARKYGKVKRFKDSIPVESLSDVFVKDKA